MRVTSPLGTGSTWNIGGSWDPSLAESPGAEFAPAGPTYVVPSSQKAGTVKKRYQTESGDYAYTDPRVQPVFGGGLTAAGIGQSGESVFKDIIPTIAGGVTTLLTGDPALGIGAAGVASGLGELFPYEGGDENAIGEPWWFVGPGLYEPPAQYVVKEWKRRVDSSEGDYNLQYYLVKLPGRPYTIWMYSQRTRVWKHWTMPRPAVIGKNMPSHKMLTRLRRNLKRHKDDAKTILKLVDPTFMSKAAGTYRRRSRSRR